MLFFLRIKPLSHRHSACKLAKGNGKLYRVADKSLARIDNSYVKIEYMVFILLPCNVINIFQIPTYCNEQTN